MASKYGAIFSKDDYSHHPHLRRGMMILLIMKMLGWWREGK
jgi:hypothetical protein